MSLQRVLRQSPVIAAVRREADLPAAIEAPVQAAFLLCGDINNLESLVASLKSAGKLTFVHLDLIGGLASDPVGVGFLARRIRPDGVISTRGQVVRAAVEAGLIGIQRFFVVDSGALDVGIRQIRNNRPSAVEVLPGTLPQWVFSMLRESLSIPVVAGGLLRSDVDIREALGRGASAVSVSRPALWQWRAELAQR